MFNKKGLFGPRSLEITTMTGVLCGHLKPGLDGILTIASCQFACRELMLAIMVDIYVNFMMAIPLNVGISLSILEVFSGRW